MIFTTGIRTIGETESAGFWAITLARFHRAQRRALSPILIAKISAASIVD